MQGNGGGGRIHELSGNEFASPPPLSIADGKGRCGACGIVHCYDVADRAVQAPSPIRDGEKVGGEATPAWHRSDNV